MHRFILLVAATLALSACHKTPHNNYTKMVAPANVKTPSFNAAPISDPVQRKQLVDSADHFEDLTDAAFGDRTAYLPKLAKALSSAVSVRPLLAPDQQALLDAALATIGQAEKEHKPVDLSLGSNEAFRVILTRAGGEEKVPLAIGMLDYAGYRITADARDPQPRWEDMAQAQQFANQQWVSVKPRIERAAAADAFDHALTALLEAIAAKDVRLAKEGAARLLTLVDVLEKSVRPA